MWEDRSATLQLRGRLYRLRGSREARVSIAVMEVLSCGSKSDYGRKYSYTIALTLLNAKYPPGLLQPKKCRPTKAGRHPRS